MAGALSPRRIAIVGAGVAGLEAARRLAVRGLEVAVFDKARRPGGRVSTRRSESHAFDHGAQYFTVRDPEFEPRVRNWCARGVAARWDARIASIGRGACERKSDSTPRFVGVPGMSALARELSLGLRLECGRRVERLEQGPGGWRVLCDDGSAFVGFDAAVVAAPAPQATALLKSHPEMARRVAGVEMQPCHAAMVAFEESPGVPFDAAFVRDSPLAWVARNASKPGRATGECWVLQTTSQWSSAHLEVPPENALGMLLDAFAEALGRPLPGTLHQAVHRWRFARSERPLGQSFLWDPDARLGVCGDWCLGGRIEGAYLSGHRLAKHVLSRAGTPRTAKLA